MGLTAAQKQDIVIQLRGSAKHSFWRLMWTSRRLLPLSFLMEFEALTEGA
jgi:hypothetical protein